MGVCKSLNSNTQFEEKNSPCGEGNWFWTLTFEWIILVDIIVGVRNTKNCGVTNVLSTGPGLLGV